MSKHGDVQVTEGSGNVFADLGLSNADELLVKADLAIAIKKELDARGWTQQQAADRVFLTQPQISKIRRVKTAEFSIAKLQEVLRYLGVDVDIHLHKREDGGIGTLRVLQA